MTDEATKLIKLGQNIKKARNIKGYSQNVLAELLDISREHLAHLETAKRKISLGLLFKMADILDTTEKELLDFTD